MRLSRLEPVTAVRGGRLFMTVVHTLSSAGQKAPFLHVQRDAREKIFADIYDFFSALVGSSGRGLMDTWAPLRQVRTPCTCVWMCVLKERKTLNISQPCVRASEPSGVTKGLRPGGGQRHFIKSPSPLLRPAFQTIYSVHPV